MRRTLVLLLVSALVAAACSSDSESSSGDTATEAVTTAAPAVTTTAAPAATTTAAPAVTTTTAAPVVTTTTAAPVVTTTTAAPPDTAPALPGAVEGALLDGATPEGLVNLMAESNTPLTETCPGTPIFGGAAPTAYSLARWVRDTTTGPFLDVWVTRFESAEVASQAINDYNAELIGCGEFLEPTNGVLGTFVAGANPELGDESFGHDYAGTISGFGINRYSVTARVGDTIYHSGLAVLIVAPDPAVVLQALNAILGS